MLGRPLGSSHPLSNNSHAVPRLLKGHSDWVTCGCGAAFALPDGLHSRCTLWQKLAKRSALRALSWVQVRAQYSSSRLGGVLSLDEAYKERWQRLPFFSVMGVAVAKEY